MFNNVALDVVIGLVLVYLLYSFFATIISEILAAWFGLRARVLRLGIERMLNDGYYEKFQKQKNISWPQKLWRLVAGWLRKFFYYEVEEFKQSFAGRFYNHTSIQYLAKGKKNHGFSLRKSKPSYISADAFADTILHILREKGAGNDDLSRINFALRFNSLQIQPETLKHFRHLVADSGDDLTVIRTNLKKWFDETMDRTTGWYKRKIKLILFVLGLLIASTFNVDTIAIAKLLARDKSARDQLVKMAIEISKDSTQNLYASAGTTDSAAQSVLDSTLAIVRKDINQANAILGLGWGFDTLYKQAVFCVQGDQKDIIRSIDSLNRRLEQMRDLVRITNDSLQRTKWVTDSLQNVQAGIIEDTVRALYQAQLIIDTVQRKAQINSIKKNTKRIIDFAEFTRMTNRKNKIDSANLKRYRDSVRGHENALAHLGNIQMSRIDSVRYDLVKQSTFIYGSRPYTRWERFVHVFSSMFGNWMTLLGIFITALALTLGAPFWFDLLRKLVSIRSAGVKPEEKPAAEKISKPDQAAGKSLQNINLPAGETPVETALRIYGTDIRKEKGVVNVAQGFYKRDNKILECVQVNVIDHTTAVLVRTKYEPLIVSSTSSVYMNVLVTGKAILNFAAFDSAKFRDRIIANEKLIHGPGSFGCVVKEKFGTQKFLLSCFHVMKGDFDWSNVGVHQTIINVDGEVANSYQGHRTSMLDIAIAKISEKTAESYIQKFGRPAKELPVTVDDVFSTKASFKGCMSDCEGLILHHNWAEDFDYPLPNGFIESFRISGLIAISKIENGVSSPISEPGDSGALLVNARTGNALGIVIGRNLKHTFAIKLTTIFSKLGIELA